MTHATTAPERQTLNRPRQVLRSPVAETAAEAREREEAERQGNDFDCQDAYLDREDNQ